MNRYENGKIYKITDNAYTKCYIGSTCESLSQRMARHRKEYRNYLKGGKYFFTSFNIFNEFGIDNCFIELLENCPCDTEKVITNNHWIVSINRLPEELKLSIESKTENKLINKNETTIGKTKMTSMKDRNKNTPVPVGLLLLLVEKQSTNEARSISVL